MHLLVPLVSGLLGGSLAARVDAVVIPGMAALRAPGVIVGVEADGERVVKAYGVSDTETRTPMSTLNFMRIGSVTKTFTASAILLLVKDGKLKLSDKLSQWFPTAPNAAKISIEQLLNMTSGLGDYADNLGLARQLDVKPTLPITDEQILKVILSAPPRFGPGAKWSYCNANYFLLGEIIEKVSGMAAAEFFRRRITEPLGLKNCWMPGTSPYLPTPFSQGYMYGTIASNDLNAKINLNDPQRNATFCNPSWASTAGEMISTVQDQMQWAKEVVHGALIGPELQKKRLTWATQLKEPYLKYGLGCFDVVGFIGHNGEIPGYQTWVSYNPSKRITIVVLSNLSNGPTESGPADTLAGLLIRELAPNSIPPKPAGKPPSQGQPNPI